MTDAIVLNHFLFLNARQMAINARDFTFKNTSFSEETRRFVRMNINNDRLSVWQRIIFRYVQSMQLVLRLFSVRWWFCRPKGKIHGYIFCDWRDSRHLFIAAWIFIYHWSWWRFGGIHSFTRRKGLATTFHCFVNI